MPGSPRLLVIGDVMTDIVVRPEGPLARGSDRRATIRFEPGGSAANQAAWLAAFGVAVDFVARVGAADVAAESARLIEAGVTPHLAADPDRPTGRLIALIDPSGERSFFTDRGANETLLGADIPDALIAGAAQIHLSGYSFFAPCPRAAVRESMRRAGADPRQRRSRVLGRIPARGRARGLSQWTRGASLLLPNADEAEVLAGSADPDVQCARLAALYPLVVIKRRAGRLPRGGGRAALGGRRADDPGDRLHRRRRRLRRRLPRRKAFGPGDRGGPSPRRLGGRGGDDADRRTARAGGAASRADAIGPARRLLGTRASCGRASAHRFAGAADIKGLGAKTCNFRGDPEGRASSSTGGEAATKRCARARAASARQEIVRSSLCYTVLCR